MTKNMTRKSLALGAAAALVVTGFSAMPANAAGLADTSFVSLAPSTGPTAAFTVIAGTTSTFSLTSNEASTIVGGNVKFLVEGDLAGLVEPTATTTARTIALTNAATTASTGSTKIVTITETHNLAVGDLIQFSADVNNTAGVVAAIAEGPFEVLTVTGTASFTFQGGTTTAASSANTAIAVDRTLEVLREARDGTTGEYVVDSGTNSASTTSVLVLGDSTVATKSVTVTSWVDSNGNDLIDTTEYASPVRTVTFKKSTELALTTSMDVALLGASALTASVTTVPALNGTQVLATSSTALALGFERQGIAGTNYDPTASWDSVNLEFDFSIAPNASAVNGLSGQTGTDWSGLTTVIAGTYSATGYAITSAIKSASVYTTVSAVVADDIKASVAGSANVTPGTSISAASTGTAISVRAATTSLDVVADVYTSLGVLVGAGIPVTATYGTVVGTHKVNGTTAATSGTKTALTDASGRVTFAVVSSTAVNGNALPMTLVAQGVSGDAKQAEFAISWATSAYDLVDLNDNGVAHAAAPLVDRSMNKGGSVTFDFAVVDQWGQAIAEGHRLRIATTGRTVGTTFATINSGRASVTVLDGGITTTTNTAISMSATVEMADGTSSVLAIDDFSAGGTNHGAIVIDVLDETNTVTLDADTGTTYVSSTVADDADAMALIALAAQDLRVSNVATPVPGAVVTVTGVVKNATTADVREGAVVTISGDSDFLFQIGTRYAFGSLTFIADASGEFAVNILSNKAVTDSVVTVTSNGASNTTAKKVSFTAAASTTGTSLVVTSPSSVSPGSTFQVVATLTDKYGNAVAVGAGYVLVEYAGPGIVFGALPTTFNAKGQLQFAVLLGANDSGTAALTVSYDQSADSDYTGTAVGDLDLVVAKTVTVGAVASATKVNVGSFKGYVALYAKGYAGQKMSAIVAGKWIVVASLATDFERVVRYTGAGYDIVTTIYIDGVKVETFNVTTK
jgi:hypothetical protein